MKDLPRAAQSFLWVICCLGLGAFLYGVQGMVALSRSSTFQEFMILVLVAAVAGPTKIRMNWRQNGNELGTVSVGFTLTFLTLLRCGISASIFVACVNCFVSCLNQKSHQRTFNVALSALESLAAGLVLEVFQGRAALTSVGTFAAIVLSALTYYVVNTGGVVTIMSLCTRKPIFTLWKEDFLWTAPSYIAGATLSAVASYFGGSLFSMVALFLAPALFLIYYFYRLYSDRAREKQQHFEEIQAQQRHLADLYLATIKSLALAIDAKDQYTHQHILRVQHYAVAVGERLGLSGNEMEGLKTGALLHDIGKLGVPEYVLLKPGKLTPEEFDKIKKHPEIGAAILDPVEFPWPVLPVVKYHHEKWDGSGYPEGLKGEQIPLTARILAVADVYDALTSTRSYRNAWTHERAIELIRKESGTHFDPVIAEAFLAIIDDIVQEMAKEGNGPLAPRDDMATVWSKADQAARDIHRASSELWALYEVAQTLSASMGLQETLDILARKLEAILPGTSCLFLLQSEDNPQVLVAQASVGLNKEMLAQCRTNSTRSRSYQVVVSRESYCGEYDHDDLLITGNSTTQWTALHSSLIVPIVHQGEALGTINLYHQQVQAFTAHDQHLLEMIAERAALALYNGLLYDRTRNHAFTDPLTDLYNLRFLTQYVDQRCQQSEGAQFAVLCLDLDNFKPINDNFGHQRGDQVLRELAAVLRSCVSESDVVARYGGDEFLIILENAGPQEAHEVGEHLRDAVRRYNPGLIHVRVGAIQLGVSVGYACYPEDATDFATLISTADARMYQDKTDRKLLSMAGGDPTRSQPIRMRTTKGRSHVA